MSLLTICQNVAADIGIQMPQPPIFGSTQPTNQRIFAQARRAGMALYRRAPWVELVTEYNFTASGVSDYPLPADFGWILNDTLWESSRYWALRGSMSPQQWRFYKNSIYGRATIWRRWRIRLPSGSKSGAQAAFSIDPALGAGDTTSQFVFEYVSKNWCISNVAGQPQAMAEDWTSDNDDSVLDERLIELDTRWRVMRRLGLAYDDEQDEAEREIDKAVARNGGTATLDLVPWLPIQDFVGMYTLTAFPPQPSSPAGAAAPPAGPAGVLLPGGRTPAPRPPLGTAAMPYTVAPPPARLIPAPTGILRPTAPPRSRLVQPPMSDE